MFGCVMTLVIRQTCGSHWQPGEAGAARHTAVTICIDEIGDLAVPVAGWLLPLEVKHKINVKVSEAAFLRSGTWTPQTKTYLPLSAVGSHSDDWRVFCPIISLYAVSFQHL